MMKMYLIVSIPPILRGVQYASADNDSLQNLAIQSWKDSGFTPLSVNTIAELNRYPEHAQELARMGVDCFSVEAPKLPYPDYLPSLRAALLRVIAAFPESLIAVTNADIIFNLSESGLTTLRLLGEANCLVAHRTDIDSLGHKPTLADQSIVAEGNPSFFGSGIDFVAAKACSFSTTLDCLSGDLILGLPWWDLFLPLALVASNHNLNHLDSTQFLHFRHSDRWEEKWWNLIGKKSSRFFYLAVRRNVMEPPIRKWIDGYLRASTPLRALRETVRRLKCRLRAFALQKQYVQSLDPRLLDIVYLTESLVCIPPQMH